MSRSSNNPQGTIRVACVWGPGRRRRRSTSEEYFASPRRLSVQDVCGGQGVRLRETGRDQFTPQSTLFAAEQACEGPVDVVCRSASFHGCMMLLGMLEDGRLIWMTPRRGRRA